MVEVGRSEVTPTSGAGAVRCLRFTGGLTGEALESQEAGERKGLQPRVSPHPDPSAVPGRLRAGGALRRPGQHTGGDEAHGAPAAGAAGGGARTAAAAARHLAGRAAQAPPAASSAAAAPGGGAGAQAAVGTPAASTWASGLGPPPPERSASARVDENRWGGAYPREAAARKRWFQASESILGHGRPVLAEPDAGPARLSRPYLAGGKRVGMRLRPPQARAP